MTREEILNMAARQLHFLNSRTVAGNREEIDADPEALTPAIEFFVEAVDQLKSIRNELLAEKRIKALQEIAVEDSPEPEITTESVVPESSLPEPEITTG